MEQTHILTWEKCPVCDNAGSEPFLKCKDYTVSAEYFPIVICQKCGFRYTNPVPAPEVIGRYYKSEDYISHSDTRKGLVAKLYHLVRSYTLRKKQALIEVYRNKGRILDFGCGTGYFLMACKSAGWRVFGVEPDSTARKHVPGEISTYASWQELSAGLSTTERFDVISMWHVLEHVYDLKPTLRYFHSVLEQQGALCVAVPNYRSRDAKKYKEFWAAYDVPRHLYHFDKDTLGLLASECGFRVERVVPMRFDSYYVSMLSEKYRGAGILGVVKGVMAGFFSNLAARKTGEYSSLIYILRKRT